MSDAMTLFGGAGNSLVSSDLFKSLMDINKTLAGSPAGVPRISIKGGKFREIVGGEQVRVFKGDALNVVVVNAAPIGRTYFEGAYDPNNAAAPTCWSADSRTPSPDVPEDQRMAAKCADCPMNVKGSGQGEMRACRYSQRLAVLLEGDTENTVYQMQLPATSIFGEAKNGQMGMQAYAKLLAAHQTPIAAIVTAVSFDEDTETPKLYFKPVRPLSEDEMRAALEASTGEAAKAAITMTVSQTDGVAPKADAAKAKPKAKAKPVDEDDEETPALAAKAKPAPKAAPADDAEEEDEAPKKRTVKTAPAGSGKQDLASIIGAWDDDDEE